MGSRLQADSPSTPHALLLAHVLTGCALRMPKDFNARTIAGPWSPATGLPAPVAHVLSVAFEGK
jgi:hypothetical protein